MGILQEPAAAAAGEPPAPEQITRLAVAAAVQAPSVHNTQPWWFSEQEHQISVHADTGRRLQVADPDGREILISCGAALFNIRVALRHLGYVPEVSVLPHPDRPDLVARVRWRGRIPAVEYEEQLFAEIERRRTHRDAFLPAPLPPGLLAALREEAAREAGCCASRHGTTSAPRLPPRSRPPSTPPVPTPPARRNWHGGPGPPAAHAAMASRQPPTRPGPNAASRTSPAATSRTVRDGGCLPA
jgi:hypothetical protein